MAEIHDKLRGLLENQKLQTVLAEAFYAGIDSPGAFETTDLADHIRHARGIIDECDSPFKDLRKKVEEVIQAFVIDKLPEPAPVTLEDVTSIAIAQLAGIPLQDSVDYEEGTRAYSRFMTFALSEIEAERYGESFDFGRWIHCTEDESEELGEFETDNGTKLELWSSPSGFRLCLWNPYYMGHTYVTIDPFLGNEEMRGLLQGYCSDLAKTRAQGQLERVIGSIVKTIHLCLVSGDGKTTYYSGGPITFLIRGDGRRMLSACLSAYWRMPGSGENTILDRLHNAIVLLPHADQAGADPIALSLSFAAIEALVCEEGELPVNKQIKRHVATLLVQDAGNRKACEKVVGRLYDIRCQVMHGNRVNASSEASDCVRRIAAGVVRSVVCWMANQERSGHDNTSWKEFMNEVNAAARKPGEVVGVPDLSELIPDKVPE